MMWCGTYLCLYEVVWCARLATRVKQPVDRQIVSHENYSRSGNARMRSRNPLRAVTLVSIGSQCLCRYLGGVSWTVLHSGTSSDAIISESTSCCVSIGHCSVCWGNCVLFDVWQVARRAPLVGGEGGEVCAPRSAVYPLHDVPALPYFPWQRRIILHRLFIPFSWRPEI